MYSDNGNVTSELISSYAWDTALNFICQTNSAGYTLATTMSSTYGNINTGSKTNTGAYSADNYSNIHDLLGNCYEWTTEYSDMVYSGTSSPCVHRGACYKGRNYAACRYGTSTPIDLSAYSFRIQLYIK